MIAEKMKNMVANSSAIRAMFEEGNRLAQIYGAENVFDFSLGNPNVAAPEAVKEAIIELLDESDPVVLHGYTNSNSGYADVRETVAKSLNERFGTKFEGKNIVMSVGAAGGLNVILKALINPGDEVIAFAPYFGEYRSYTNNYDGVLVEVSPNTVDFQPKLDEFEQKITPKTKAVIVNTPNNPTGVVYSEETIKELASILEAKQKEYGTEIYLISDEPYRELVYDGVRVPYLTKYYDNTIVGYSYSKSLSLPGSQDSRYALPARIRTVRMCLRRPMWRPVFWDSSTRRLCSRSWLPSVSMRRRIYPIITGTERHCIMVCGSAVSSASSRRERSISS